MGTKYKSINDLPLTATLDNSVLNCVWVVVAVCMFAVGTIQVCLLLESSCYGYSAILTNWTDIMYLPTAHQMCCVTRLCSAASCQVH